jgi:hypothetical protein
MGDTMGQGIGLAGASTGDDQQRTGDVRTIARHAMFDSVALLGVECR